MGRYINTTTPDEREAWRERFELKVSRGDGCWLWTGPLHPTGYPVFNVGNSKSGNTILGHRFAWELAHGQPIPAGRYVLHSCDVRACVRPDHLFVGTAAENSQDMVAKGRNRPSFVRGEDCGQHKLTEAQVLEVKRRLGAGESAAALGREFGVSKTAIRYIRNGRNWKHISPETRG